MPRKIRELRAELRQAGFTLLKRRAKGSHTAWRHPDVPTTVIIAGHDGGDADHYQEDDVREALAMLARARKDREP